MIFSKFRKPRWQHQDAQVRCEAVLELDIEKQKDKDTLRELAFNDGDHSVRLTAIKQLNDFNLCWMALQQDKDKRVRQWCHKRIEQQLIAPDNALSSEAASRFINECRDNRFLESLWKKLPSASHRLAVVNKLNKPQLFIEAAATESEPDVRKKLLDRLQGKDELNRLLKKLKSDDPIYNPVAEKLAEIEANERRPEEVSRELVQVKAIFAAVKEKHDFEGAEERLSRNIARWKQLQPELKWLPKEELEQASEKVAELLTSAESYVESLRARWQEQHAEQLLVEAIEQQGAEIKRLWEQLSDKLQAAIDQQLWNAQEELLEMLVSLSAVIDDSQLAAQQKEKWQTKLLGLRQHIEKLALIPQTIENALQKLSDLENRALPGKTEGAEAWENAKQYFAQWRSEWRNEIAGLEEFVPQDMKARYEQATGKWHSSIEKMGREIQQLAKRTHFKLGELNRLLDNGRSKDASGLLKKVESWYQQLPESEALRLNKRLDQVRERVQEIADWKAYAGTPKKEQLIKDVAMLVDSPLADPVVQAQQIKEARATWQTLGQLDTEEDRVYNKAFNELCEKAFQPCREFYQQQETLRAEALVERESLCDQMEAYIEQVSTQEQPDWRSVESEFHRLNNQWRQCGSVERDKKKDVFDRYRKATNQVKAMLRDWHDANRAQKQALLNEAKQAASDEDIKLYERANQIKAIQQKWKQVGYAGKDDQSVWTQFRATCDALFSQLKAENAGRRQRHDSAKSEFTEKLNALSARVGKGVSSDAILADLQLLEAQLEQADELSVSEQKQFAKRSAELHSEIGQRKKKQQLNKERDVIAAVLRNQTLSASSHPWLTLIEGYGKKAEGESRHSLVVEAEILSDSDTPTEDAELRQQIQLRLLTAGASIGNRLDIAAFLKRWVAAGEISDSDNLLIERMENALVRGLVR